MLSPKMAKDIKKQRIQEELKKITIPTGLYLPTNPDYKIVSIIVESGNPM